MTRKDYILIAAAINKSRVERDIPYAVRAIDQTVRAIGSALADDNPRFDRERFLRAAGVVS